MATGAFVPAKVAVKTSRIHGRGVFAAAPIAAGTPALEYEGERITSAEARARYPERPGETRDTYLLRLDGKTVIDGNVGGGDARFVNHSCEPTCELLVFKKRVFLVATRDLERGEELTYDYNLVIHGDVDVPTALAATACSCGARTCRGTMLRVDDDPEAKRALVAAKKRAGSKKGAEGKRPTSKARSR